MVTRKRSKRNLWIALKNYNFNGMVSPSVMQRVEEIFTGADAATQAFVEKLAYKRGWTKDFARRAVEEYRKFVYLGMVSEFSVTPSKVIDQVWHQHLQFTAGYDLFCQQVLGQRFDHFPELVPMDDQTGIFHAQYEATLDLYRREFGKEPPMDIWSVPKFDPKKVKEDGYEPHKKRVDSGDASSSDDTPLFMFFDGGDSRAHPEFAGFNHGESGGAGGGGSWEETSVSIEASSGADSSSSGSGDSGGGSDGGGSSGCSSGCGGGCGS
jgi:hypothetical protein